ncbi:uncharacterized protein MYCFIDRAFT_209886 [Pseudocercospora fijiensis CIRAD86]|uniref:Uncharacterized protein n=1 Tax=Pseudocercospora fijiensis (strain CIRAD86) TaxID=383855 RepID=N1Q7N2_PSEFD|nr:uncharacterized protein MYCFIDRAFT_209886 [Pseudocercospora fijiensis CIRAD86]EME88729.1 hypothetical protein MYCFIDRAFT_209886 [Pseudocercospora fijiensis CIRAD86]
MVYHIGNIGRVKNEDSFIGAPERRQLCRVPRSKCRFYRTLGCIDSTRRRRLPASSSHTLTPSPVLPRHDPSGRGPTLIRLSGEHES